MFRVALIACLSVTTALGPALCCCNAQQLFSMVARTSCCGKSPTAPDQDAALAEQGAHAHCLGHHGHKHPPGKDAANTNVDPVSHEHDGQNCPCGNRQAGQVATSTENGPLKVLEFKAQTWLVPAAILPASLSEFDALKASSLDRDRPADLFGREMLRAYQIMRC